MTWSNVTVRICGSRAGVSVAIEIQADEPMVAQATGSLDTRPTPRAEVAPSPPPTTTGVPSRRPTGSAISARTPPATVAEGTISGSNAGSMSAASSSSGAQRPAAWSYAFVPEASEGSMQRRPVRRRVT